jgi:hypothetical protein
VNNIQHFDMKIEELCVEHYPDPPEEPLGELSEFEMGIRRFCFEHNYQVSIQVGNEIKRLFLDPDICMLLEDNIPEKVLALSEGKPIEIVFLESSSLIINLVPIDDLINCTLQDFGYSSKQQLFKLDKNQVLEALKSFLYNVMEKAVIAGYITSTQKEKFLRPMQKQLTA